MSTGSTPTGSEAVAYPTAAIGALTGYQQQLDSEGERVGVSRQALDEVLAYVSAAPSVFAPGREAVIDGLRGIRGNFARIAEKHPNDQPSYADGVRPWGTGDLRHATEILDAAILALTGTGAGESAKQNFNRGYLIAVANLMNLHGAEVEARDTLDQLGATRADMEALGLTDYDLEPLRRLFAESERLAELSRKRSTPTTNPRASTPADTVAGQGEGA